MMNFAATLAMTASLTEFSAGSLRQEGRRQKPDLGAQPRLLSAERQGSQIARRRRSEGERLADLLRGFRCFFVWHAGRQLQHGRVLAFDHAGQQHDLAAGEFERVVMRVRPLAIDLPEARRLLADFAVGQEAVGGLAHRVLFEGKLGARTKAYRDARRADRREAAGEGVGEVGGHQFVADLSGPRRYAIETVVAHLGPSSGCSAAGGALQPAKTITPPWRRFVETCAILPSP